MEIVETDHDGVKLTFECDLTFLSQSEGCAWVLMASKSHIPETKLKIKLDLM